MLMRGSTRLRGYDYSQPGGYFVTICTKDSQKLLGDIVDGVVKLSGAGQIVHKCWRQLSEHFENITLDEFILMPNHLMGSSLLLMIVGAKYSR